MKKMIAIAALFVATVSFAQEHTRGERLKKMMNTAPEETAEMQTKRLTLALVLDDKQQEKVYDLYLAEAKERKAQWEERSTKRNAREKGVKPTEEEIAAMRASIKERHKAMLDKQIAHQEKMQNILNEEQFDEWRKLKMKRHERMAMRDGKRRDRFQKRRSQERWRK